MIVAEPITTRELMVLFHHTSADADTWLDEADREEHLNLVVYLTDRDMEP